MSNRITRIIVALLAIPFLLGLSYWGEIPFLIFTLVIGLVSFYEFSTMVKNKNIFVCNLIGFISVALIISNAYFHLFQLDVFLLSAIPLLLLIELFRNKESAINNLSATLLGIFYAGFFSATLIGIREFYVDVPLSYTNGGFIIITIFITLWMTDSAAYFIGSAIGKNKLFPRVSPNKSWEGAIAGFVFAIITLVVLKIFLLNFLNWVDIIAFGVIIGIFGQVGDLIESLIKRDAGVKDSSNIIPGHGGIFDRFDSLLFSAPIIYLYLVLFAK
ncbi:MAG: phosphatidate cytidylyltransferase [Melioribacteraceae bacterium]|jgi:phosphatidate cytidylyltransferase|nr:phosphatidate cytidylyltransferase [Melioribacteraceae bacterium]